MLVERTSKDSVGVTGLIELVVLTDARGFPGDAVVIGERGSGLTTVHSEEEIQSSFPGSVSFCIASELRITRKCVLSDGVMVTVFINSGLSFLMTCIWDITIKSD